MAYDSTKIALDVARRLYLSPGLALKVLATVMSLDRHTVTRAVQRHFGVTFRLLRYHLLTRRLQGFRVQGGGSKSMTAAAASVAKDVGYGSASALRRATDTAFCALETLDIDEARTLERRTAPVVAGERWRGRVDRSDVPSKIEVVVHRLEYDVAERVGRAREDEDVRSGIGSAQVASEQKAGKDDVGLRQARAAAPVSGHRPRS